MGWPKGKPRSAEDKAKIKASSQGKIHTAEHLAKISAALRGRPHTEKQKAAQTGHEVTSETREKLRKAHTGTKMSVETKAKMSMKKKGSGNSNWKGGITPPNHAARNTEEYSEWREAVFRRDAHTCQDCDQIGGGLHAHHIRPFSTHPELRYDVDNGITLCEKCHKTWHSFLASLGQIFRYIFQRRCPHGSSNRP